MEKDEALIEAVRDYQCLYNSKSADFNSLKVKPRDCIYNLVNPVKRP